MSEMGCINIRILSDNPIVFPQCLGRRFHHRYTKNWAYCMQPNIFIYKLPICYAFGALIKMVVIDNFILFYILTCVNNIL